MNARVSVVIPALNGVATLPASLSALVEGLTAGVIRDLVIADGGSTDGTLEIADAAGAEVIHCKASRGAQLRAGVAAARGDWLLILHADTVLSPGWAEAVLGHMEDAPGKAGYFRLRFDAPGLRPAFVAGWANLRARLLGLPFGDQGLLISRALYERVGGFDDIPLMEDVAMARALGRGRLALMPASARTSAARYATEGWLRRGARNLALQLRYFSGVAPERLAQRYRR